MRDLTSKCKGMALYEKDREIHALNIKQHIDDFDFGNRPYFCLFLVSEIINFLLCFSTFLYYFFLLRVYVNLENIFLDLLKHYDVRDTNSHMMILFPREISCIHRPMGNSGGRDLENVICTVTNQDWNEYMHVAALVMSTITLALYILNIVYIIFAFFAFPHYAKKNPTKLERKALKKLTLCTKLCLILTHNNMDRVTFRALIEKIISTPLDEVIVIPQDNEQLKQRKNKINLTGFLSDD